MVNQVLCDNDDPIRSTATSCPINDFSRHDGRTCTDGFKWRTLLTLATTLLASSRLLVLPPPPPMPPPVSLREITNADEAIDRKSTAASVATRSSNAVTFPSGGGWYCCCCCSSRSLSAVSMVILFSDTFGSNSKQRFLRYPLFLFFSFFLFFSLFYSIKQVYVSNVLPLSLFFFYFLFPPLQMWKVSSINCRTLRPLSTRGIFPHPAGNLKRKKKRKSKKRK